MSGWVPMPVEAWPLAVERLQASAEAWPEELCLFDLRWLYDQRQGRLPGRPALCARWNVTDRIARRLLADTGRWWDAKKGPAPTARVQQMSSERPARVQPVSSDGPADERTNADNGAEMSSPCPADVQPVSSERPHARRSQPQPQPQPETAPAAPDAWDRLSGRWRELHPGGPKLSRDKGQGLALKARIDDHGEEAVARVLGWAHRSQHQRAVFLRDQHGLTLATLCRPGNFEQYLGFAAEERPAARAPAAPPPSVAVSAERKEALRAAIARRREDGAA